MTRKQKTAFVFSCILTAISLVAAVFGVLFFASFILGGKDTESGEQLGWGIALLVMIPFILMCNIAAFLSGGGAIPLSLSLRKAESGGVKIASACLTVLDVVAVVTAIAVTILLFVGI